MINKKPKKITILKQFTNFIKISMYYFINNLLSLFINNSLLIFKNERGPNTIIEPRATFGFFDFPLNIKRYGKRSARCLKSYIKRVLNFPRRL